MAKPNLLVVVKLLKTDFLTLKKVSILEYYFTTVRVKVLWTALKTADAGYLTRRLHDVSQDVTTSKIVEH
jgi:DNA-directed RNA polymerase beta' subunit